MYDHTTVVKVMATCVVLTLLLYSHSQVYAQKAGERILVTGAGEIAIELDILFPDRNDAATEFTITFSDPVTGYVEKHVYYDFILKKDDKDIFRASQYNAAPVAIIHSTTGIEKQFFTFSENGSYTASVIVYGLKMVFVQPVEAEFSIAVTPEFTMVAFVLSVATASIVSMRFSLKRMSIFN